MLANPLLLPPLSAYALVAGATAVVFGVGFWVPSVVKVYGRRHFAWTPGATVSSAERAAVVAVALLLLGILGVGRSPAAILCFASMLVSLAGVVMTDRRFQVIPDRFQAAGLLAAVGLSVATLSDGSMDELMLHGVMGLAVPCVLLALERLYVKATGRPAMGLGDIKLLTWLAMAFGVQIIDVLGLSLAMALVAIAPSVLFRRRGMTSTFAFGPYLALAAACWWTATAPLIAALGLIPA